MGDFNPHMTAEFPGINFSLGSVISSAMFITRSHTVRVRDILGHTYIIPVDGGAISTLEVVSFIHSCGYRTPPNHLLLGFTPTSVWRGGIYTPITAPHAEYDDSDSDNDADSDSDDD
jgi:hypothetical protein